MKVRGCKLLALLLAVCLVAAAVPGKVSAAAAEKVTEAESYDALKTALQEASEPYTKITLTGDIEVESALEIKHNVTIVGDGVHTVKHGTEHTDTMFNVSSGVALTLQNVTVDAGAIWTWDSEKLTVAKEKSLKGENCSETDNKCVSENTGVQATGNLFELANNTTLEFSEGSVVKNYYKTNGYVINIPYVSVDSTDPVAKVIFNKCEITHIVASGSGIVNGGNNKIEVQINSGAEFHDNYSYLGHGGISYLRNGSTMVINEGAKIHDNVGMKCNGVVAIVWSNNKDKPSVLTVNGGEIYNNVGLRGSGYTYANMFYPHQYSEFIMNGGYVHDNYGSSTSVVYQNIGGSTGAVQLNGGRIENNHYAGENDGPFNSLGDIFLSAESYIGERVQFDGALYVYGNGKFEIKTGSSITGDVCIYSEGHTASSGSYVNNHGKINGSLYIQDGSNVTNETDGEITGNVILVEPGTTTTDGNLFTNKGTVNGDIQLAKGGKAVNEGTIQGTTDVKAGAELVLHGTGTLQGTVTVYPGGDIRANEKDSAQIDGTLILEYRDEADLARMQEIFRASGITPTKVEYRLHEHKQGAAVEDGHKEATCTEPGYDTYTCLTCLDEYQVVIPIEEHTQNAGTTHTTRDCTVADYIEYECTVCKTKWTEVTKEAKAHTLVADGNGGIKCANENCDYTRTITEGSGESCADGNHAWTESVTKPATCTEKGEHTLTCQKCGATLMTDIPATGHTWGELVEDPNYNSTHPDDHTHTIKAATCEDDGLRTLVKKCTVCGATDEATRIFETLPRTTEHTFVDVFGSGDGKYKCTDTFTAQCNVCQQQVEFRGKAHTWGENGTGTTCTVCGETRDTTQYVTISYQYPGAMNPPASVIAADHILYTQNSTASLWKPAEGEVWRETLNNVPAVFIGWSETHISTPVTAKPTDSQMVTEVTLADREKTVYAVWAQDLNGNGTPDYDEKTYTIMFDIGTGATGTKPADMTGLLAGIQYNLPQPTGLKDGSGNDFAGWSTESLNALRDHSQDSFLAFHYTWDPATAIVSGDNDTVTFHAVYAEESYKTGSAQVSYHVNGGEARPGANVTITDGIFYTCSHFHAVGSSVTTDDMFSVDSAKSMIRKQGATLIGWSLEQKDLITTADGAKGLTRSVTLLDGGATLYAVWAEDKNGNDVPDYLETGTLLTHTWFDNADLDGTLPEGIRVEITGTLPAAISGKQIGDYIEFDFVNLPLSRTDYNADNTVYHHYVQLGWSGYVHGVATSASQAADWILTPDENPGHTSSGKTYRWLRDARFQYAYAVWAIDDNKNDIPDYAEYVAPPVVVPPTPTEPNVTVEEPANGDVQSNVSTAEPGENVTVTAKPDRGYITAGVTVVDEDGGRVTVKDNGDGTFTFEMPDGEVTVEANFQTPAQYFVDAPDAWYQDAVAFMVNSNLMGGTGGRSFEPNTDTSRATLVTILWRLEGCPAAASSNFDDVKPGQWYADAVDWAAANNIVFGRTTSLFDPNVMVTREDLATILFRYAKLKGYDLTKTSIVGYKDANEVGSWADEAMCWAVYQGLIRGTDSGALAPADNSTRATAATILMRFCEELVK